MWHVPFVRVLFVRPLGFCFRTDCRAVTRVYPSLVCGVMGTDL
jgi:hypothetical protein